MNDLRRKEVERLVSKLKEFYSLLAQGGNQQTLSVMYESRLTLPQVVALHYIFHCKQCSISSISERLNLSLGATSHLVDRLVQIGYLSREENPEDRRMKLITITKKGNEFLTKLNESRTADMMGALSMIEGDKIQRLADIIGEIIKKLKENKGDKLCQKE
ncbi:MAG: MarR family winged helix-turn-helix transcriptional regulator [Myxococcota bacterium]